METLGGFLARTTRRFGQRPALLWKPGYRTDFWSYHHLWERSNQMAALLAARGVERGDRVVIWAPNSPWWVAAYFGILLRGAVVVPLDLRCGADFVRRVIALTEPSLALLSTTTQSAWDTPIPHLLVNAVGEQTHSNTPDDDSNVTSNDIFNRAASVVDPSMPVADPGVTPDDIAEIMFTSGTTGEPNGVTLTHRNIRSNVDAVAQVIASSPEQRLLSILPLSHMFEQTIGLLLPLRGGASIFYPTSRQPTALFRDLNQQGVTTVLAVPQALQLFMSGIERQVKKEGRERSWGRLLRVAEPLPFWMRRLLFRRVHQRLGGRMRFFVSGGAPLDPALLLQWERLGIHVLQGYGATEAAPAIAGTTFRDRRPASVGRPLPGVEVTLAPDGEVLVKGPNVTPGYWRNSDATQAAFRDGWYATGDLGSLDRDGYLYLHGRKREMIVLASGQNVFPIDVERALTSQPGIADAVVLGLPARHGAEVHAVLLLDGPLADDRSAVRRANTLLADHQKIRSHTVWPDTDFPRTHTMKVKRGDVLRVVVSWLEPDAAPAKPSAGSRYPMAGGLPLAASPATEPDYSASPGASRDQPALDWPQADTAAPGPSDLRQSSEQQGNRSLPVQDAQSWRREVPRGSAQGEPARPQTVSASLESTSPAPGGAQGEPESPQPATESRGSSAPTYGTAHDEPKPPQPTSAALGARTSYPPNVEAGSEERTTDQDARLDGQIAGTSSTGDQPDEFAGGEPSPLQRLIATTAGVPAASLSRHATLGGDIGLDSLSRVELLAAIEDSFGVYLDESRVGPDTTIAELERMLGDSDGQSAVRPVFPSWPRSALAKATRGAAQVPTFALLRTVVSVDVSCREHLAGLTPPVLFVANHTSHLDTPTVLRALPASWRRRTAVAAAADYFFTRPVVGAGVGLLLNAFPFSRTSAIRPTLEHCGRLFDEGWSILLYPEGTRSTDGSIAPFKTGVGLIAMDLGVPVVPIAIEGLGSVLPKGRTIPRRGRATVAFGPPLTFEKGTSYAAATAEIEAAVRRLLVNR